MKKNDYGNVKVLLAMENPIIRQGLQNALQHEGFSRAAEATALDKLISALIETQFDLIVLATELAGEFVPPFIAQMRQGTLVHHPLPVVIELLAASESDYIKRVIDSGPDDLLQLPVSPGQLLSRIGILSAQRKPFVVTSDYVGPDRRQNIRPGSMVIPLIEVPNPLAMKVKRVPEDIIAQEISESADQLRQLRLERYAFELQWLLRAIRQMFQAGPRDEEKLQTFCERIKTLLLNMPRLLPETKEDKITPLADRLMLGTNILMKNGFSADATVLQGVAGLINGLTQAMRSTLSPSVLEAAGLTAVTSAK